LSCVLSSIDMAAQHPTKRNLYTRFFDDTLPLRILSVAKLIWGLPSRNSSVGGQNIDSKATDFDVRFLNYVSTRIGFQIK
jgi:hypothetical protein